MLRDVTVLRPDFHPALASRSPQILANAEVLRKKPASALIARDRPSVVLDAAAKRHLVIDREWALNREAVVLLVRR